MNWLRRRTDVVSEIPDLTTAHAAGVSIDVGALRKAGLLPGKQSAKHVELELLRVVLSQVSRAILYGKDTRCQMPYNGMRGVIAAVTLRFKWAGEDVGPLCPSPDQLPRQGQTVLKKVGVTRSQLLEYRKRHRGIPGRCVPLCVALEWAPAEVWTSLAAAICAGPDLLEPRFDEFVAIRSRTERQRRDYRREKLRRDPNEATPVLASTINLESTRVLTFLRQLQHLRSELVATREARRPFDLKWVENWSRTPKIPQAQEHDAATLRVATKPIRFERIQEVLNKRRQAVLDHSRRQGRRATLRMLAIAAFLQVVGERVQAFCHAMVTDITPPAYGPDGTIVQLGYVRFYPGKKRDEREAIVRYFGWRTWEWCLKPWLEENHWVAGKTEGQALFPGLGNGGRSPLAQMGAVIGGRWEPDTRSGHFALIPYSGEPCAGRLPRDYDWGHGVAVDARGRPETTDPPNNPYRGWSAHAYRKALHRAVGAAHALLLEAHQIPPHLLGIDVKVWKRAVAGHKISRSLDDIYDGVEDLGEEMSEAIAQPVEDLFWTGEIAGVSTARLGPDPSAIQLARERKEIVEAAVSAITTATEEKQQKLKALAERSTRARTDRSRLQLAQQMNQIYGDLVDILEQRFRVSWDWPAICDALRDAKSHLVPIPPDRSDEEHRELLAAALGDLVEEHEEHKVDAVEVNLTLDRLATLLGVTEARVRQIVAETKRGRTPKSLARITRDGLTFERLWDPSRPNYGRRLLYTAVDVVKLGHEDYSLFVRLCLEQAREDGLVPVDPTAEHRAAA